MTKGWMFAAGLLVTLIGANPVSAQAVRHYDCTKAGNANKAACKGAAAPAPAPKATPTPTATRNYDCSKPGNANKAVCKAAAAPASAAAPAAPAIRHYDCSKAGNANKAACKGTVSAPAAAPATPPAPSVTHSPSRPASAAPAGQNTNPAGPNGATAKCKDGTLSFSAHRSGTCSRHGGVAQWY